MHMLCKSLALVAILGGLSGCDAIRAIAPQTVAGFETNGIIGALDGVSGAILARCATLDGTELRVAVDDLAAATGGVRSVEAVREARKRACELAGLTIAVSDAARPE